MARTPRPSPRAERGSFEPPPDPGRPGGPRSAGGSEQFEPPPDEGAPRESGRDDFASPLGYAADPELHHIKRDLEQRIFARPALAATASSRLELDGRPDPLDLITGVGIGPAHRDFESVGPGGPGVPVLNVYVAERLSMDEAKAVLVDSFGVRALSSDRRPINIIYTGPIDAYAHRHREQPSPCGISVAHLKVTAGTQGALARGRSGPRQNRLLLLSNNHVLANSNDASAGEPIIQPGGFDGGVDPAGRIAVLEKWVPIDFSPGASNFVDCATGWCWPDRVRRDFVYRSGADWAYFRVGSLPAPAAIGMAVGKSGRTTQLTSGRIIDVSASIRVNYGQGQVGNFTDQMTIRGNLGLFSQGGDSGSLIWTWDGERRPVGLLFAGGNELTFANKIQHVLDALDISLYT